MNTNFLRILAALHRRPRTARDLQQEVGLGESQIRRVKHDMQHHLGIVIESCEGVFKIASYGGIDRDWLDNSIKKGRIK